MTKQTEDGAARQAPGMTTATIRHEPAHFNEVCYANIPESWTVFGSDGDVFPGEDLEDARAIAKRFGYRVTCVEGA